MVHQEFQAISFPESGVTESEARIFLDRRIELGDGENGIAGFVVALQVAQGF